MEKEMFVVTGNRLLDGIVVYLATERDWVEDMHSACLYETEADGQAALGNQSEDIVSLDIIPVTKQDDGSIEPARLRERIRAVGPTISPFDHIKLEREFASSAD